METFKKYIIIAAIAVFVITLFQNTHHVTVSFLFWHITMPQLILIPLLILVGFVVGYIVGRDSW